LQDQYNNQNNIKNYRDGSNDVICQHAISSIIFRNPIVEAESAWTEHIPFGFWIINALQPTLLVELGTHYGLSYFSFCKAVQLNKFNTKCFAIDNWKGDEHAGYYDDSVYEYVNKANEEFSNFSTLKRTTFDEAVSLFGEKSIDLLHIDGLHTYEAVKHDFYNWLPKISNKGIVIFHDTNVMERGFGVYQLWEELIKEYPFFEFKHGFGLGILGIGQKLPFKINQLFKTVLVPEKRLAIQEIYQRIGHLTLIEQEYYKLNNEINLLKGSEHQLLQTTIADSSVESTPGNVNRPDEYLSPLQKICTQVYWKEQDEEFSEINSKKVEFELSNSNSSYLFNLEHNFSSLKKLRIDPSTEQGIFYLHSISIVNSSDKILIGWEAIRKICDFYNLLIFKSTILENTFVLISTTNDPIIVVNLQSLSNAPINDDINLKFGFSKLNDESIKSEFSNITIEELKKDQNIDPLQIYDRLDQCMNFAKKELNDLISFEANNILIHFKNEFLAKSQKLELEKDNLVLELAKQRELFDRDIKEANLAFLNKEVIIQNLLKEAAKKNEIESSLRGKIDENASQLKTLSETLAEFQRKLVDIEFNAREELKIAKEQSEGLLQDLRGRDLIIEGNKKELLLKEELIQEMQNKISEFKARYENNSILGIMIGRLKKLK
jgi:hypothetical protein